MDPADLSTERTDRMFGPVDFGLPVYARLETIAAALDMSAGEFQDLVDRKVLPQSITVEGLQRWRTADTIEAFQRASKPKQQSPQDRIKQGIARVAAKERRGHAT